MKVTSLNCTACGAPISVPDDLDYINCSSCGTFLEIQRGEGYVALKAAEKVARAIETSGKDTQEAIREGTYATRSELQRLQLTQERSTAQMQLSNIQAEIRSLAREATDKGAAAQIKELRFAEYQMMDQLRLTNVQLAALAADDDTTKMKSAQAEIAWIDAEVTTVQASNHHRRWEIERELIQRKGELEGIIAQIRARELSKQLRSLPIGDPLEDDADALRDLLSALSEDEKFLRGKRTEPAGNALYATVVERYRKYTQIYTSLLKTEGEVTPEMVAPAPLPPLMNPRSARARPSALKGCLLGIVWFLGLGLVGVTVMTISRGGKDPSLGPSVSFGFLFLLIGLLLGARSFFRAAAPGATIRGLFGLPDVTISPVAENVAGLNPWLLHLATFMATFLAAFLATLALMGFVDPWKVDVIGLVGVVGTLISLVLAVLVTARTVVRRL
jgi:DNA-directed RNA polymerase subunit RPC12/RpoP